MLNELIEKIIVHERERKGSINAKQVVEIHFNFIGSFTVPQEPLDPVTLAQQEEEERQIEARRDRLHQNYLKRKTRRNLEASELIPFEMPEMDLVGS